MKIYKTIYRLDFQLAYKILDKLGDYLHDIEERFKEKPFSSGKGNVDLIQRALSFFSALGDDRFIINLDLTTLNGAIDFQNGVEIDKLSKNPYLVAVDSIINKLEGDHQSKYNRTGIRSYIIAKSEELTFDKINGYMWDCNKVIGKPIDELFKKNQDIGIIFEGQSDDQVNISARIGPYRKEEQKKYFSLPHDDIEEGLILDIDIWQNNISIPQYKLTESLKRCQLTYHKLAESIVSEMKDQL